MWVMVLAFALSPMAYADAIEDAGNTMCPVSGQEVSGKDFAEVNGKKYGLCCAMCAGKLTKDPDKFLKADGSATGQYDLSM